MNLEFQTQEELYNRVKPALHAKLEELKRLNYNGIKELDIWHYLVDVKWKKSKNLMLSDIVSDIIHVDNKKLELYIKNKISKEV